MVILVPIYVDNNVKACYIPTTNHERENMDLDELYEELLEYAELARECGHHRIADELDRVIAVIEGEM